MKEQTNGERFEEFMNSVQYPELEGTNALCDDIIKKRTGKMTEEEWQAAERGEISDEEIKEAAKDYHWKNGVYYAQEKTFIDAIKWYREQLKSRQ